LSFFRLCFLLFKISYESQGRIAEAYELRCKTKKIREECESFLKSQQHRIESNEDDIDIVNDKDSTEESSLLHSQEMMHAASSVGLDLNDKT
jgi:hypothetical protein